MVLFLRLPLPSCVVSKKLYKQKQCQYNVNAHVFVSLHVSVGTKRRQCVCCVYSRYQVACPMNEKQEMKLTNQMQLYSNVTRYKESLHITITLRTWDKQPEIGCMPCACIQEGSNMCDWCQLVKTACTHSLCRHVIGVVCSCVWCLCVCTNVHITVQVCVHTLRTHLMHHTSQPVPAETGYW